LRALVIEDDDLSYDGLADLLRDDGYEVERASSVEQTRVRMARRFDVHLVDLRLGTDSGIDVLRLLAAIRPVPAMIAMSGLESHEEAVLVSLQFAVTFLAKPIRKAPLRHALVFELGLAQIQREHGLVGYRATKTRAELRPILADMRDANGNQSEVARRLAVPRTTLRHVLEDFELLERFKFLWASGSVGDDRHG